MPSSFSAAVFDLDGTLLDSLADIANAANRVLQMHGFPTHPVAAYRDFVGSGVSVLLERVLPADRCGEDVIAACAADFGQAYQQGWNIETRPYEGVAEMLDALTADGVRMAVLSNKPDHFTQLCVSEYLSAWPFEFVAGHRDDIPRKPDPAGAIKIVEQFKLPAERFLYLGDTPVDMQTARLSGMFAVGAAWGFRPAEELERAGADVVIRHPSEFVALRNQRVV